MIKLNGIYFSPLGAVEYIKRRYLREEKRIAEPSNLVEQMPQNKSVEKTKDIKVANTK